MPKMQLKVSGVGAGTPERGFKRYDGPDLIGGTYVVNLKRMTHRVIQSEANKGADGFDLLFEVCGPDSAKQYFGAPIWEGLNVIPPGFSFINAFLHALARASTPEQQKAIETAFYENDLDFKVIERERDGVAVKDKHITKIGRILIDSPNGKQKFKVVVRIDRKRDRPKIVEYMPYDDEPVIEAVEEDILDFAEAPPDDDNVVILDDDDTPF